MLMDYFQKGGPVMYPLLACSIVALAVITERFLFWMRMRRTQQPERAERCLRFVEEGQYEEAASLAGASVDPAVRIVRRGIAERHGSPTLAMEMQAKAEVGPMRRYLGILETIITLAPLLGIYGTITGIIRAFGFLSAHGLPDPKLVADGIAEALITTVAGLTIAILAIPAYNYFVNQADQMIQEIERYATTLELVLKARPETIDQRLQARE